MALFDELDPFILQLEEEDPELAAPEVEHPLVPEEEEVEEPTVEPVVLPTTTSIMSDIKGIKVPVCDGDPKNILKWIVKFQAFAALMGFMAAVQTKAETDLPDTQAEAESDTAENKAARKRNLIAMHWLMMAINTDNIFNLIYRAMDIKWPSGLAWKVIKGIYDKFKPVDMLSFVELRLRLKNVHMGNKDDPSVLFEQIAEIETRFNCPITKRKIEQQELIATIMACAPDAYKNILVQTEQLKGNALTLEDLEGAMHSLYRMTHGLQKETNKSKESGSDNEMIVTGVDNNQKDDREPCKLCGRKTHQTENCWDDPSNKDKVPDWYIPAYEREDSKDNNNNSSSSEDNNNAEEVNATTIMSFNKESGFEILL